MIYSFDSYHLDTERRELRRGAVAVSLQPQVFDLLEYLICNRGRVVSRDDMLAAVWGGRIVSESTLASRINAARSAIGDDGESQRLIRTLPRKGVRFVGTVREVAVEGLAEAEVPYATTTVPRRSAPGPALRPGAERRHLTVMSCDFPGLRELAALIDPEELQTVAGICHACCTQVAARWGGMVARFSDGSATIHFALPQAHEDDAERAVRAGLDLLERIERLDTAHSDALSGRIGIATGEVVIGNGGGSDGVPIGEAPMLAAALSRAALPGGLLVAEATLKLLGELFECEAIGPTALDGLPTLLQAWRIISPRQTESRFDALRKPDATPFVGRADELAQLRRYWSEAARGEGRVMLIAGEPGIGKSRLAAQLGAELADARQSTRLVFQCAPYHRNSALRPFTQYLERLALLAPDDAPTLRLDKLEAVIAIRAPERDHAVALLAALLSIPFDARYPPLALSSIQQRRQTFAALLDQIEAMAKGQPLLLVVEDVHWADPTSIELIDLLVERIRHLPVLGLITHRLQFEPPWGGLTNVGMLTLDRLSERDVRAMIERLARGRTLPSEIVDQIVAKADGVPLFVEEVTHAILESNLPAGAGAEFAGPLPSLNIPLTLRDSLAARLDRLGPAKAIAQIGASIGREFSWPLLRAVAAMEDTALAEALARLVEAKLVLPQPGAADASYTFNHALVQDAAYESLLRSQRTPLHARIVAAIESTFPKIAETEPELVAQHCSRGELREKAVGYWLKAGTRAVARSANVEAINHLRNGLQQLHAIQSAEQRARVELDLQLTLGQALIAARGYTAAETTLAFARAEQLARKIGDAGQRYSALYGIFVGHLIGGHIDLAAETVGRMYELATAGDDDAYLCLACRLLGALLFFRGDLVAAQAQLQQAVELHGPEQRRRLGHHFGPDTGSGAGIFLAMAEWLRGRPNTALRIAQAAIADAHELQNALTLGQVLTLAAQLHYMAGHHTAMLALSREGGETCERIGILYFGAICRAYQTWAQAFQAKPADFIEDFRRNLAAYESMGCGLQLGLFHAMLAQLLLAAGDAAEAAKAAEAALTEVAASGECWWAPELHRILGDALLRLARPDELEAENCYQRALAEAHRTGALMLELRAATSLAALLAKHGAHRQAHDMLAPIVAQFSEGFDGVDLRAATAILKNMSNK